MAACSRQGPPAPIVYRASPQQTPADEFNGLRTVPARQQPFVNPHQIEIRRMRYHGNHKPGTLIINEEAKKLYLIEEGGFATEYPVGLGEQWNPDVLRNSYPQWKTKYPRWTPTDNMHEEREELRLSDPSIPPLPDFIEGGDPNNPLGSRAIYLHNRLTGKDTLLRIHGTNLAGRRSIGTNASSGCVRMLDEHVEHLYYHFEIPNNPRDTNIIVIDDSLLTPGMDYTTAEWVDPYERRIHTPQPRPSTLARR